MNQEERLKRIAEAAYYRSQRRGFAGDCRLDDWLAAEREVAALESKESEAQDQVPAALPEENRGIPVPAPLAKEERIRTEEIKQSARELAGAAEESAAPKTKRARKSESDRTKGRKRSSSESTELRRSV